MNTRRWTFHVLAFSILFAAGWYKAPFSTSAQEAAGSARGYRDNGLRKAAGLREIGPGWICFRSINGKDEWLTQAGSAFAEKTVRYDDSLIHILSEDDLWRSGRKCLIDEATLDDQVGLAYDYTTKKFSFFCVSDDKDALKLTRESLAEAEALKLLDAILTKWGKSRL